MEIRPLHDRVILKSLESSNQTQGGIIIPDTAKERSYRGEVLAVGRGRASEKGEVRPLTVKAGDEVLFEKHGGTEIDFEGERLLVLRESDILGLIK